MKFKTQIHLSFFLALTTLIQGCSTVGKSIGLGAGAGAALGGGVGALADPGKKGQNRIRNILIGSAIGGAVGAGSGYLAHRLSENDRDDAFKQGREQGKKETSDDAMSSPGSTPNLIPPKTEAIWMPDQVRGQTFVPGHFEYRIIEGAHWQVNR